jgi:hypothetical protein
MAPHIAVVGGLLGAGFLMVGLLFLRFWSRTRDGLFMGFAVAFGLIALGQIAPAWLGTGEEDRAGAYLFRLAGYVLIIAAIVWKNLKAGRPGR